MKNVGISATLQSDFDSVSRLALDMSVPSRDVVNVWIKMKRKWKRDETLKWCKCDSKLNEVEDLVLKRFYNDDNFQRVSFIEEGFELVEKFHWNENSSNYAVHSEFLLGFDSEGFRGVAEIVFLKAEEHESFWVYHERSKLISLDESKSFYPFKGSRLSVASEIWEIRSELAMFSEVTNSVGDLSIKARNLKILADKKESILNWMVFADLDNSRKTRIVS